MQNSNNNQSTKQKRNYHKGRGQGRRQNQDNKYRNHPKIHKLPDNTGESIVIDGSYKEGGGQVLRNASTLAAILKQSIWIHRIRAGRVNPGLRAQHLTGLEIITEICNGTLVNGEIGSQVIQLQPGQLMAGKYEGDTKTAGSCTLLAQSVLPALLYATPTEEHTYSEVTLRGGTDVPMAPLIDYFRYVLLPTLRRQFGIEAEIDVIKRGFYPVGGGIIKLRVMPLLRGTALKAIEIMEPGDVTEMKIHSFAAGRFLSIGLEKKIEDECIKDLRTYFGINVQKFIKTETIRELPETAVESGAGCCVVAETNAGLLFGGSGLFEDKAGRRVTKQEVFDSIEKGSAGVSAAFDIQNTISRLTGVDEWMQDQLIIFMALAEGTSRIRVYGPTSHTETAIMVAEEITKAKFRIEKDMNHGDSRPLSAIITCEGIGLKRI